MNQKVKSEAVYFSEERITKMKQVDEDFREEMKRDEKRIIAAFLENKVRHLKLFKETDDAGMSKLQ